MKDKNCIKSNISGGIFGLVVGDALGVPHEFNDRSLFDDCPVSDMEGFGTYHQPPGTFSDDSSLTLATLDGLCYSKPLKNYSNEDILSDYVDYQDIMGKFANWLNNAEYTPYNDVFDVGITTRISILEFDDGCEPLSAGQKDEHSNGNGSLMRILPVALFIYYLSEKYSFSIDEEMEVVHNISSLTHAHKRSQLACGIYVRIAIELLKNKDRANKEDLENVINDGIKIAKDYYDDKEDFQSELHYFDRIFSLNIASLSRDEIKSSGYVLASLEASIWCILNTDSYKECVLKAVNLGHDTDTTAAIVGGIAGIYYGFDNIPRDWLNTIAKSDLIEDLIDKFTNYLIENIGD